MPVRASSSYLSCEKTLFFYKVFYQFWNECFWIFRKSWRNISQYYIFAGRGFKSLATLYCVTLSKELMTSMKRCCLWVLCLLSDCGRDLNTVPSAYCRMMFDDKNALCSQDRLSVYRSSLALPNDSSVQCRANHQVQGQKNQLQNKCYHQVDLFNTLFVFD